MESKKEAPAGEGREEIAWAAMKPILFNTEMVRAILEGRKTATRRVVPGEHACVLLRDGTDYYPKTDGWYISEEKIGAVSLSGFYIGDPTDGIYFPFEQIGKTVFLTREEAEAALAEKAGEGYASASCV